MAELPGGIRGHAHTAIITIFFFVCLLGGGEAGHFGGEASTPQIP